MYGFAAGNAEGAEVQLFLLNKSEMKKVVRIELVNAGFDVGTVRVESFVSPGRIVSVSDGKYKSDAPCLIELVPFSFNRIVVGGR